MSLCKAIEYANDLANDSVVLAYLHLSKLSIYTSNS